MKKELIEKEFKNIMQSENAPYFNVTSRSFELNNREEFIYNYFKDYRKYSDRRGPELLFGAKNYKGIEHVFINIDKDKLFQDNIEINYLELYKNGIIFTEGEFFVF